MNTPPVRRAFTFDCPHCGALTMHEWPEGIYLDRGSGSGMVPWDRIDRAQCIACDEESIWLSEDPYSDESAWRLLWPAAGGEPAHERLPADLLPLYNEARAVAAASPRAAAALLRLLTERLLRAIAGGTDRLDDNIAALVKDGTLNDQARKLADYLRITGNDMVHPGQIDADAEAQQRAGMMFPFVNLLVNELIAKPAVIDELYQQLPESKRNAADRRDGRAFSPSESK